MPIHLITGKSGSGKTSVLLDKIYSKIEQQNSVYVVPNESIAHEIRKIALKKHKVLLGDIFLPINFFIKKIASVNTPIITFTDQTLLILKILSHAKLKYFKYQSLGVAKEACKTIHLLKKNLISSDELKTRITKKLSKRNFDFLCIYNEYEEQKSKSNIIDESDLLNIAISKIKQKTSKYIKNLKFIAFDEFDDFNNGEIELIKNINTNYHNVEINISFPDVEDKNQTIHSYLNTNKKKIQNISLSTNELIYKHSNTFQIQNLVFPSPVQETSFISNEINKYLDLLNSDDIYLCINNTQTAFNIASATSFDFLNPFYAPFIQKVLSTLIYDKSVKITSLDDLNISIINIITKLSEKTKLLENFLSQKQQDKQTLIARNFISISKVEETIRSLFAGIKMFASDSISSEILIRLIINSLQEKIPSLYKLNNIGYANMFYFNDSLASIPKILFIPEATSKNIPTKLNDNLFFTNEEIIQNELHNIFPSTIDHLAKQEYLFYKMINMVKGELIFTRSLFDISGKETENSPFLEQLGKPEYVNLYHYINEYERDLNYNDIKQAINIEKQRLSGNIKNPEYHGILKNTNVKEILRKRFTKEPLTPTSLEKYANCPFSFYVNKVLKLQPEQEISPEILPKDQGNLIHMILERFYKNNLVLFKRAIRDPNLKEEISQKIQLIIDDVFNDFKAKIDYSTSSLHVFEKNKLYTVTKKIIFLELEQACELTNPLLPHIFEWKFGYKPENILSFPIDKDFKGQIQGRIDRIDLTEDMKNFLVVDYKSGKTSNIISKIKEGLHFQLPLYILAADRFLNLQATSVGGILIGVKKIEKKHGILKKDFNGTLYTIGRARSCVKTEEWDDLINTSINMAKDLIIKIRDSLYLIKSNQCPIYCEYKDVCRYNEK